MSTLQKIELLGDDLVEFLNDTIEFYQKFQRVAFLSKYSETLQGAQNVVPVRELVIDMIKMSLMKTDSTSSLDLYKQAIAEKLEGVSQKTVDIVATSIYARRQELQKVLTDLIIEQSADKMLIDYNYNIQMNLSSSSS